MQDTSLININIRFLSDRILSRIASSEINLLESLSMLNTGRLSTLRYAIIATQLLCLSACTMLPSDSHDAAPAKNLPAPKSYPVAASAVSDSSTSDHTLNEHRVIVPSEEIVKDGLQLSYSIKSLANEADNLLQLSLVFRNMNSKVMVLAPKVALSDAKGVAIPLYNKKAFDKVAASMLAKSKKKGVSTDKNAVAAMQEQLDWDKAFWMSSRFKIPAGGIQIGGLVFHSPNLEYPLKLSVDVRGDVFQFTIKDTAIAVDKKPDAKKAGDCHSPALGTALYVGSKPGCR
jgi:hypothetical protein